MERSSKDEWLQGPGDLEEADVEDVPVKGKTIRVRGLPAAYSSQAQSESLKVINTSNGEQVATMDQAVLEVLQFAHGCVDPQFTEDEARTVSERFGPAFKKVIGEIDRLSGVNKEALEAQTAKFPAEERSENGSSEAVEVQPPARSG